MLVEPCVHAILPLLLALGVIKKMRSAEHKALYAVWFYLGIPNILGYLPMIILWFFTGVGNTVENERWETINDIS